MEGIGCFWGDQPSAGWRLILMLMSSLGLCYRQLVGAVDSAADVNRSHGVASQRSDHEEVHYPRQVPPPNS